MTTLVASPAPRPCGSPNWPTLDVPALPLTTLPCQPFAIPRQRQRRRDRRRDPFPERPCDAAADLHLPTVRAIPDRDRRVATIHVEADVAPARSTRSTCRAPKRPLSSRTVKQQRQRRVRQPLLVQKCRRQGDQHADAGTVVAAEACWPAGDAVLSRTGRAPAASGTVSRCVMKTGGGGRGRCPAAVR